MSEESKKLPEDQAPTNYDFGKKKKKKKTKDEKVDESQEIEETQEIKESEEKIQEEPKKPSSSTPLIEKEAQANGVEIGSHSDGEFYSYEFLAKRIYDLINASGEQETVKYTMKPPVVYREGTKKTIWVNFPEICKIMNRQPEHVLAFLLAEVGTTGSIDGNGRFVIKGRFQPKHIENILRRYISEYVKCHTCKTPETHLKRENRLLFMVCDKCGSTRTVSAIKTGFQATTRSTRRAARTSDK